MIWVVTFKVDLKRHARDFDHPFMCDPTFYLVVDVGSSGDVRIFVVCVGVSLLYPICIGLLV